MKAGLGGVIKHSSFVFLFWCFLSKSGENGRRCCSANSQWSYVMIQKVVILSLKETAATSEEYSYIKRSLVFWSLEICFVSSLRGRYSLISWYFWTNLNQAEVHYCLSQVLLSKTSATPWIMKESVPGTSRRSMIRLSTLLTASLVFCRRNLSAGRRGCWQPGCVLVWMAPAQRRHVRGRSDAGRRWGYLETENRSGAFPPTGQLFWDGQLCQC